MRFRYSVSVLLLVLITVPGAGQDIMIRTVLPLKTPRGRDPVLGGPRDKVAFSVWIPAGVKTVRGAICNPFSRGDAVSTHWKGVCRLWQFAYVQMDFDAVRKEEFVLLKTALTELAKESGHPEVAHMPFCFIGMSRGGGMSMQLSEMMPERTLASTPVCLEVGPRSEATRRIPVLTIFGERDGSQMSKLLRRLPLERKQSAHYAIAVQWGRRHEFARANNLSFVFFDDVIRQRLPPRNEPAAPSKLNPVALEAGWLGDVGSWGKDGRLPTIASWKSFRGDRDQACWFPSQRTAAAWRAFVAGTNDVKIEKPAGLGDKKEFVVHAADKPVRVKINIASKVKPATVELWDAHLRLAVRTEAPWTFEVKLPPGVHCLFAAAIGAEQTHMSRPNAFVVE